MVLLTVFCCEPNLHFVVDGLRYLHDRNITLEGDGHKGTISLIGAARVLHLGSTGDVSIFQGRRS